MTNSIKPPGTGPTAMPPAAEIGEAPDTSETGATGTAGQTGAAERTGAAEQTGAARESSSAAGAEASSNTLGSERAARLGGTAGDLRAGRIDAPTAVDRLIEQHLASGIAAGLTEPQRAHLRATLRAAFANDPTLQAMLGDLER